MARIFYVNIDTQRLQTSLSNTAEPSPYPPEFSLGDCPELEFRFVSDGAYTDLTADNLFVGFGTPSGKPTQGSFYLTYDSVTTADPILAAASAADVQEALEGLTTIGAGNVSVTGNDGGPWTVEFIEDLELTNVGAISTNAFTLLPLTTITVDTLQVGTASVNEIQVIRLEQTPLTQLTSWTTTGSTPFAFTGQIDLGTTPLKYLLGNKARTALTMDVRTLDGNAPTTRLRQVCTMFNNIGSGGVGGVPTTNRGSAEISGSSTSVQVVRASFTTTGNVIVTPILSSGGIPSFAVTKANGSFTITTTSSPEIVSGDGKVFTFDYAVVADST